MMISKRKKKKRKSMLIKWVVIGIMPILLFMFLVIIIIAAVMGSGDDNKLAIQISVPVEILRECKSNFGDDYTLYLTRLAIDNKFDWEKVTPEYYTELKKIPPYALKQIYQNNPSEDISFIYNIYRQAYSSLEYFPIPDYEERREIETSTSIETRWDRKTYEYQHYNDFGAARNYKEERKHEGNDVVADAMTPLVSITDGVIDKYGWNEHGGWRVGIKTKEGAYFYYAHMEQYAAGLYEGKHIKAGDHIGYVGDTGYGPPGTQGKFINHLHFQIGIDQGRGEKYFWINPYDALKLVEGNNVLYISDGKTSTSIEREEDQEGDD